MRQVIHSLVLVIVATACVNVAKQKPEAVGDPGEVSVYVPNEYRDQGLETLIDSILDASVYGTYTAEPMFDVSFESEEDIKDMLDRNIIEIKISENTEAQLFQKTEGLNARNQMHVIVYANSVEEARSVILQHAQNIRNLINNEEYDRAYKKMSFGQKRNFSEMILAKQKVDILIPSYLDDFLYNSEEFSLIAGYQTDKSSTGKLIIQQYLYVMNFPDNGDSLNFTESGLLWQINNYLESWALLEDDDPGGNAYMQISNDSLVVPFRAKPSVYRESASMELSGNMYSVDPNESTPVYGGYFKGLAVRDVDNERIVVAIGMVNVPKDFLYREYLRRMNVIVHTLQF